MAQSWQEKAHAKREQRAASIPEAWRLSALPSSEEVNVTHVPRTCGLMTQKELEITEDYDATALAQALACQRLSAQDVTVAFCKRAAIAQQVVNCLTEVFFETAIERAKALDSYIKQHNRPIGPLHGVPISLKDSFKITGMDSSIGFAALVDKPSLSMSPLVSVLLSAGAIIYCKTNVPQTMMALDSVNNVFGRTLNPVNTKVTAGGSSGGEGALMAMGGSVLGVGTDIGGSIRIPASCNDVYGFMPSAHRVPYANQREAGPPSRGSMALESRAGPLTRSVRDAELFMKSIASMKPWSLDPMIIPGYWDSMDVSQRASSGLGSSKKGLVFGVLSTDHVTQPLPPIRKLLQETSEMLKKAGHTVVPLQTPGSFTRVQSLANSLMGLDGGETMFRLMNETGEPLIPWLAGRLSQKRHRTVAEAGEMHERRTAIRTEMLAKLWRAPDGQEIDALICPVAPHPTPRIDNWGGVGYTSAFVYLDYCAGTVPVRAFVEADTKLEFESNELRVLGSWDKNNRRLWRKEARSGYIGTGMSVQVAAPRLEERRLARAMTAVDAAVKAKLWDEDASSQTCLKDLERLPFHRGRATETRTSRL